jgi:outer membrane immunogenic protein
MKKVLLAGVAGIALVTGSAHAADLGRQPVYKAPPPAIVPAFSWTGCYIGGNIGGGWGRTTASAPSLAGFPLLIERRRGQVGCAINSHFG